LKLGICGCDDVSQRLRYPGVFLGSLAISVKGGGVFTWHPVLKLPMPWWIRAPLLGSWMNFVLTFFAYDTMAAVMVAMFGQTGILKSPFWFVLEGALVGLIIEYFARRFGGEGPETVEAGTIEQGA
jgi:hypothetical protein